MRFMAASADTLLVVSTDEPTALADAYAVLKLQARDRMARSGTGPGNPAGTNADVRLVINQSNNLASGRRTYDVLARACNTFLGQTPSLAGIIRRDGRRRGRNPAANDAADASPERACGRGCRTPRSQPDRLTWLRCRRSAPFRSHLNAAMRQACNSHRRDALTLDDDQLEQLRQEDPRHGGVAVRQWLQTRLQGLYDRALTRRFQRTCFNCFPNRDNAATTEVAAVIRRLGRS